jgi:hypothetical protein
MGVTATIISYEWQYQGRKLELQLFGDGSNNSETEDTQKPRSTVESSDSIDRKNEHSQGYFDVLLQAIYGLSIKLLSEYQHLSKEGVFPGQPGYRIHLKRMEFFRKSMKISKR